MQYLHGDPWAVIVLLCFPQSETTKSCLVKTMLLAVLLCMSFKMLQWHDSRGTGQSMHSDACNLIKWAQLLGTLTCLLLHLVHW